jgi:hypothetical protein
MIHRDVYHAPPIRIRAIGRRAAKNSQFSGRRAEVAEHF